MCIAVLKFLSSVIRHFNYERKQIRTSTTLIPNRKLGRQEFWSAGTTLVFTTGYTRCLPLLTISDQRHTSSSRYSSYHHIPVAAGILHTISSYTSGLTGGWQVAHTSIVYDTWPDQEPGVSDLAEIVPYSHQCD